MADKDIKEHIVETLEQIADYAAMIQGALKHLRNAGLSIEGSEAVLLHVLGVTPALYDDEFEEDDCTNSDCECHQDTDDFTWEEDD